MVEVGIADDDEEDEEEDEEELGAVRSPVLITPALERVCSERGRLLEDEGAEDEELDMTADDSRVDVDSCASIDEEAEREEEEETVGVTRAVV